MANSATQNPANKVGRNSGAGPSGVSRINPTEQELRSGLPSINTESGGWGGIGASLGAVAVLGAGVAAYVIRQRQQARTLRGRFQRIRKRIF